MKAKPINFSTEMVQALLDGRKAQLLPKPQSAWEILGISPRATAEEINAAYRKKAKECHPDAGGSVEAMERLNKARDETLNAV